MAISQTLGSDVDRAQVTIPGSTDVGTTISSLLQSAGFARDPLAFRILGTLSDGTTARGAITLASRRAGAGSFAATDYTTHGEPVAAGVEYRSNPGDRDFESAVRAASGGAISAIIVAVY